MLFQKVLIYLIVKKVCMNDINREVCIFSISG